MKPAPKNPDKKPQKSPQPPQKAPAQPAPKQVQKQTPAQAQPAPKQGQKQAPAQAQPAPPVKAPAQQQQPLKQEQKVEVTRTIKLPQMLTAIEEDKSKDKVSLVIDTTGNAYTFFKYKGRIADITDLLLEEAKGGSHEKSIEQVRTSLVHGLKSGDNLVFFMDIKTTNLNEFLKSKWYQPEVIYKYSSLMDEKYYRKDLLQPEEDVDYLGNKGFFTPKKDQFLFVMLTTDKQKAVEPQDFMETAGLYQFRDHFVITKIED